MKQHLEAQKKVQQTQPIPELYPVMENSWVSDFRKNELSWFNQPSLYEKVTLISNS